MIPSSKGTSSCAESRDNIVTDLGFYYYVPYEDSIMRAIFLVKGVAILSVIQFVDSITITNKGGPPLHVVCKAIPHHPTATKVVPSMVHGTVATFNSVEKYFALVHKLGSHVHNSITLGSTPMDVQDNFQDTGGTVMAFLYHRVLGKFDSTVITNGMIFIEFTGGKFYTLIAGNAATRSSLAGCLNICSAISVPVQTYFSLAGPSWGFSMPNAVVSALLNSSSNLTVISNAQLGRHLPLIHSAFSANGQYLTRKQAVAISPTASLVIARSPFSFICLLGPLGSSLALRPRYYKFLALKKFVRMSTILQCPMILVICSASRYEQYLGWHFILGYSTFASKLYVNNNSRGSTDGAAAFSYGTDMKDFRVDEKNVLLVSLATSSVTIYWFSALVGSFVQLSTVFLQAQHAQILPKVRHRTFHSLCCCCYVHVCCDKGVAAMASVCYYVRYTVWCSMHIGCHSGEVLSYTKGHHSLVHSLPWCGIIQDDIVSAESNCERDASDSLSLQLYRSILYVQKALIQELDCC